MTPRLAIVTSEYQGVTSYTGGIGGQYAGIAPALVSAGVDVTVVTQAPTAPSRIEEKEGVRLVLVAGRARGWREPIRWLRAADRAIQASGPYDAVLAPEYTGAAALLARRRDAPPVVTHLHTSLRQIADISAWPRRQRFAPVVVVQRLLERYQTERSSGLLSPTEALTKWTSQQWRLDGIPVATVPNAVKVDEVRRLLEASPPEGFPATRPVVAFAGRLEHRKGVDVLVEAMRSVWQRRPEVELVLIGGEDPPGAAAALRERAGAHGARVHALGARPRAEMLAGLAAADVVALPSRWENFSIVALEAMALGKPIVASSVGGFPEFLADGSSASLVRPEDPQALADAIERLLADPAAAQRLGDAAQDAARGYDVAAVAARYVMGIEEVTGRRVAPRGPRR